MRILKMSQSLLNQVNVSDLSDGSFIVAEGFRWSVAIPSKSGQCFRRDKIFYNGLVNGKSVAIPSKSGQCFRHPEDLDAKFDSDWVVAIPSKSGQCFRLQIKMIGVLQEI